MQLILGNEDHDYYVNSVVMVELWGCCMDSNFGWQALGNWNIPLQRVLNQGSIVQWLTDHVMLGPRLAPWFAFHERDE